MEKSLEQIAEDSKYLKVSEIDGKLIVCEKKQWTEVYRNLVAAGAEHESTTPFFYRQRKIVLCVAMQELRIALSNIC